MGQIFDRVLSDSAKYGYIASAEIPGFKKAFEDLAAKYQINVEDMAAFMMMESGVPGKGGAIDSKVINHIGCVGLIQFCADKKGSGLKRMVGTQYPLSTIVAAKPTEQLKYVDLYFQENQLKKGAGLDELYLTVLAPARRSITDLNTNLRVPGSQSSYLYSSAGYITRNSLLAGLRKNVAQRLSMSTDAIASATNNFNNAQTNQVLSGLSNLSSVLSGIFARANCTPPPYTQSDFITYTGCGQVVATAGSLAGMGFGSAAPGIGALATGSSPNVNGISREIFNSPTKGMFAYPIEKEITFTSGYGMRGHPILGKRKMHHGIDLAGPTGLKILAAADGVISSIQNPSQSGGYGNHIVINHGSYITSYSHLNKVLTQQGAQVKQGQVIGELGTTGRSTGPHLHFEIRDSNRKSLDPALFIPLGKEV